MTSINHIIDLSSDEEDDKLGDPVDLFDVFSDEETKRTGYRKSKSSVEEDDDDCVVLDCDPLKTTEKETTSDTCKTDDDDILVVGQKGEIACRDFPHPRHACAKYPFKSTSHDKYCDMCHCYVCDIRAPCPHWCNGISSIGHCHANDKEQIWKNQREFIRIGNIPPPQSLLSLQNPWLSPVNQFGIRPCSAPTMAATRPNTYTRPGYRPEQPRAPQLFQNQRGGSYNSNPSPQVFSSKPFSRTQRPSVGANLVENGVHNVAQGSQYTGYATPPTALQGSSQRNVAGYASSRTNMYAIKFSRKTRSGNAQTSAGTLSPPAKRQRQQAGISDDKVLSEIEDWLMDTPTDPVCPLSGQVNSTTFRFDFETFFND